MSGRFRNGLCPCGSGRKFKRCCADGLEDPRRIARQHDAVGGRIQAWAFEHHREAMCDALAQITSGYTDRVLGHIDLQLIASWMFNDCQLPGGGTAAERYAQGGDLPAWERDLARRIAAARLGLLRVVRGLPGRWIELQDLAVGGELVRAISHGVSRSVCRHDVLVARLMDGPPAPALWGPVGFLTRELRQLLDPYVDALDRGEAAGGLAAAMQAASREITVMLAPALGPVSASPKAA